MKFRPLHDRVVVRRVEEDSKTAGGIIIPDTAKEKPMQGEVIAVGPGARDEAGNLYVANGQVFVYAPDGALTRRIDVPERPLQLLLGGADRRTLYILAHHALYAMQL